MEETRIVYVPTPPAKPPLNWGKVAVALVFAAAYWFWPLDLIPGLPFDDLFIVFFLLRWAGVLGEGG